VEIAVNKLFVLLFFVLFACINQTLLYIFDYICVNKHHFHVVALQLRFNNLDLQQLVLCWYPSSRVIVLSVLPMDIALAFCYHSCAE